MLRALLYGLAILHLGPGVAFAVLAFGCEGGSPQLAAVCGANGVQSFMLITAASWLILGLALAALLFVRRSRTAGAGPGARAIALVALLLLGAFVAAIGAWLTGSQYWYLVVPSLLAVGWLFVADPLACESSRSERPVDPQRHQSAA